MDAREQQHDRQQRRNDGHIEHLAPVKARAGRARELRRADGIEREVERDVRQRREKDHLVAKDRRDDRQAHKAHVAERRHEPGRAHVLAARAQQPRQKPRHGDLQNGRRRHHEDIIHNVAAGEIRHAQHGVEDRRREQDVHHQRRDALIELRPRDADARTKVAKEHDEDQHGHLGKNNGQIHFSLFLSFLGFSRRAAHGATYPV